MRASIYYVILAVVLLSIATWSIVAWLSAPISHKIIEVHAKEKAFRSLGNTNFSRLIILANNFVQGINGSGSKGFGGYLEPAIPIEFNEFGFDRITVKSGIFEGRVYWFVDSGGYARIDTTNSPNVLHFVTGARSDIVDTLYSIPASTNVSERKSLVQP